MRVKNKTEKAEHKPSRPEMTTQPDLYITTAYGEFGVILQGQPLCAMTTREQAESVLKRTADQLKRPVPTVEWHGERGEFVEKGQLA